MSFEPQTFLIEVEMFSKLLKSEFSLAELVSFRSLYPYKWTTFEKAVSYSRIKKKISLALMLSLCLSNQSGLFEVSTGFYLVILTHVIARGLQGFIGDPQHLVWVESL